MIFLGTIVNALAIALGSAVGVIFKKNIPEKLATMLNNALALGVIYVGIYGAVKTSNMLIVVLSLCIGAVFGELIDFDKKFNKLGDFLQSKVSKKDGSSFSEGFVSSTMLFCIGAMTVVGAIESGMKGNHEIYYTKAILDGVIVILMSASLGIGCMFSAFAVLIYQGTLTATASFIAVHLTADMIDNMSVTGSVIILAIGLNMLGLTKIKIGNLILAPFLPILLIFIQGLI